MKRQSSPALESAIQKSEQILCSGGVPLRQAKAMIRLPMYLEAAACSAAKQPTDVQLFQLFREAVIAALEEIGELASAEKATTAGCLEQLTPIMREAFDIRQPVARLNDFRLMCNKLGS